MLKEKGIAVIFEKEGINTMTEQGEMFITLMSTLAQNEVESLSQNVKMGIRMKQKRGEMMGFNGCLGSDYHPEDKSITVNEEEAETVRLIFELYLQGYGTYTIARQLTEMGRINKKGGTTWTDSGILGIIKNEKYKGDLLMKKTFTVEPYKLTFVMIGGITKNYYITVAYDDGNKAVREFGVPADEFADCFKIIMEIIPVTEDVPEVIRISKDCDDE